MEAEVSGKRHVRDGSVTVAELIRRQPYFVAVPVVPADPEIVPAPAAEPEPQLVPEDGDRAPSLRARILAAAIGTVALFGAVGATAAISTTRPIDTVAAHAPSGSNAITGAGALRPDLVAQRLGYLPRQVASTRDIELPSARTPAADEPGPGAQGGPAVHPPAADLTQPTNVVREFYRRLQQRSDDATGLLDPELLGADSPGFRSSWAAVRQVTPDSVTAQPDGSVLGAITVRQEDGSLLHMQQRFFLTAARPPLIDRVELVSAQQS